MFTPAYPDATASTVPSAHATIDTVDTVDTTTVPSGSAANHPPYPPLPREQIRHLLFGTPSGIQTTIQLLHKLGYAELNDWSHPISTGRPNEAMAILTKRVNAD